MLYDDIQLGRHDDATHRDRDRLNAHLRSRLLIRSGGDARDLPSARIVYVASRPSTRVVIVECPFAGSHDTKPAGHEYHVHGWPHYQRSPGTRIPHCDHAPDGFYRLDLAAGVTSPRRVGETSRVAEPDTRLDRFLRRRTP